MHEHHNLRSADHAMTKISLNYTHSNYERLMKQLQKRKCPQESLQTDPKACSKPTSSGGGQIEVCWGVGASCHEVDCRGGGGGTQKTRRRQFQNLSILRMGPYCF